MFHKTDLFSGCRFSVQILNEILFTAELSELKILKQEKEFALYQGGENKWLYLKSFGSVVFCGYSVDEQNEILKKISSELKSVDELPNEKFVLSIGAKNKFMVDTNSIYCPYFSLDFLTLFLSITNYEQKICVHNINLL
mgnify:CR=1 FL=1